MSNITNSPSPTPAQVVVPVIPIEPVQPVPYIQMQQQQNMNNAIGNSNKDSSSDAQANGDDYKGLMPKWMLVAGLAYASEVKFNSSDGEMGKFLAAASQLAIVQQCFAKLIASGQNFDALKSFLDSKNNTWGTQPNSVGMLASEIKSEVDSFTTNGDDTQVEQEKQSEYSLLSNEVQATGSKGDAEMTATKSLVNNGNNLLSDEGTVGGFLEQISEGLISSMSG